MPRQNPRSGSSEKEPSTTAPLAAGDIPPDWPSFGPMLTTMGRGWPGVDLERFVHLFDETNAPSLPCHSVLLHLAPRFHNMARSLDGGRAYKEHFHPGEIATIPAGVSSRWTCKRPMEIDVLHLYLTEEFLRKVAESIEVDPDGFEIVPRLAIEDPQIKQIGLLLKAEAEAEGLLGGKLYAESLANALAISLIREHSSLGKSASRKAASLKRDTKLSKGALREALDYVGDNLEKDLTLAEVAGAARISPYHFLRLFKESTGLTPHQYVIERRVERARELLGRSSLTISEVALSCGFADQSHLSRHFKRLVGLTPKGFRRLFTDSKSNNVQKEEGGFRDSATGIR